MALGDFYDLGGDGEIKSKGAGRRVFIVSAKSWSNIEAELTRTFGTGASVMLNRMGITYGVHLAREAKMKGPDPARVLETLRALGKASGWGTITYESNPHDGGSLKLSVANCIFCSEGEKAIGPSCHLLAGICQGVAEEIYGKPRRAVETECMRQGGRRCSVAVSQ